jgi:hypothetical protein
MAQVKIYYVAGRERQRERERERERDGPWRSIDSSIKKQETTSFIIHDY